MSVERVRSFVKEHGLDHRIVEFSASSATVSLAASALGVEEARIAKTLAFSFAEDQCIVVVAAGDRKINNKLFKTRFGLKARMLDALRLKEITGYEVGGVCPFDLPPSCHLYLDTSLRRFPTVFPAAGTAASAIEVTCEELFTVTKALEWVELCSF
ncbi:MAG: YbaK/EbsC family protein [Sphaerochaetaceae bacterium]